MPHPVDGAPFDVPTPGTLNRYGLSETDWLELFRRAGGVCEICGVRSKRLCIDHEHIKGWARMKPTQRRAYVRGLLDWRCNLQIVGRGVTITRLSAALQYLSRYQAESMRAAA